MGVYIPFANRLPSSCDFCYISLSGCKARNPYVDGRPNNCPLVELKPHGRLIDADKLTYLMGMDEHFSPLEAVYLMELIANAPTIIESEINE